MSYTANREWTVRMLADSGKGVVIRSKAKHS